MVVSTTAVLLEEEFNPLYNKCWLKTFLCITNTAGLDPIVAQFRKTRKFIARDPARRNLLEGDDPARRTP